MSHTPSIPPSNPQFPGTNSSPGGPGGPGNAVPPFPPAGGGQPAFGHPARPAPSRRKAWLTHGATAFVALMIGVGIGGNGDSGGTDGSAAPAPAVTVTKTAAAPGGDEPEPAVTVTEKVTVTPKPTKKPGAATTVEGDGQYLVGEDMQAGTYKTAGPDKTGFVDNCYWARTKDASGEFDAIIANENLQGQGRVTVNKGEYFETTGCQKWTKVG
ncbi:hypothetical protein ACFWPQ_17870 [Streptomyces sp. NPDC058464]|uniref:hypothetical protein n=1 Tax=Streptomyces sp. NPDC058464 TaxID=3346511 RepID=UPI00365ECB82